MTDKKIITKADKYELLVKLKELIIEHSNLIDKIRTKKASTIEITLLATKTMRLIATYSDLNTFFTNKILDYEKLKEDKDKFKETIDLKQKQICLLAKHDYYFIYKDDIEFVDFKEKIKINNIMLSNGIFEYTVLEFMDSLKGEDYIKILEESKEIFDAFSLYDDDEFHKKLAQLYDYNYLLQNEYLHNCIKPVHLYIACKKVLNELLKEAYILNLTDKERENFEKKKQIRIYFDDYEDLKELNTEPRNLLEYIAISDDLQELNEILESNGKVYTYINQTIRTYLSEYFKDKGLIKKGGFNSIKRLLKKHPEWFEPKSK